MKLLTCEKLAQMSPEQIDELPGPVEFRSTVIRRGRPVVTRIRRRWARFGWVDEGAPVGDEVLLIARVDDFAIPSSMEVYTPSKGEAPSKGEVPR